MSEENTVIANQESETATANGGASASENKPDNNAAENNTAEKAAGSNNTAGGTTSENATESPPKEGEPASTPAQEPSEAETLYKNLGESAECKSLLKKHLTKSVFEKLKDKKTAKGGTLAQVIKAGCEYPESVIGVYAPDPEAYTVFAQLLDPIIKNVHLLPEKKQIHHPNADFGDLEKVKFDDLDPEGKYIVSTRVRLGRSLEGYGFHPVLTKEVRAEMEGKVVEAVKSLEDDLQGVYYPLSDMDQDSVQQLVKEHYLFSNDDKCQETAGAYEDWPAGRGIFYNQDKTFLVWVGEEDHVKVISMQTGGDIGATYARLVKGAKALEGKLTFARDARLGNVSFCPSNLGTNLRASVVLNIPTLSVQSTFQATLDKLHLQSTESEGGACEISNRRRVGLTELQAVTEMYNGAKELIKLDKELTWKPETLAEMADHVTKNKGCKSLMKKYLTKDVVEKLKDKTTSHGATLADCIRSGAWNLDSGVGIYAADPESYTVFQDMLDPVIKDYHKLKSSDPIAHPTSDFGDLDTIELPDLDPENELIVSTRIRVARSHKDFAFPPVLSKEDRESMEKRSVEALNTLTDELEGTYHPLSGMDRETQDKLTKDHFLFTDSDRFLKAAGGYTDWPTGRGIFFNESKTFLVWVNEEDHLRIISMQQGGDLGAVYKRLVKAVKVMEEALSYARDDRLGYLTFCPTNLGTTLRASVHIKIPKLAARKDFRATCDKLKLQARGIHGEHTESEGGVYDISNKRRLGLTELQAVTEMYNGVKEIIKLEKDLQAGKGAKSSSCTII
ncbi:arginine kinase-like [Littorina saxatilis]|uniref:arginine kinase-like n=1 Tax=Littorina saxatilis TaxID=31220 RepID=UPI0038B6856B